MDRFRIERLLGKGSFGSVRKVVRTADGKVYAMKIVKMPYFTSEDAKNALNEVRLLASLKHPHIVRFYEAFLHQNTLRIVMEYAKGGDLARLIERHSRRPAGRRRGLDEARIWRWALQLTAALDYLHRRDILHRDLKPANCFLDGEGRVRIGDLNISKALRRGRRRQALAQTKIGTPYYMAPEVWVGRRYGAECDMWSLGCLLYQLAALDVPFTGRSVSELSRNIQVRTVRRIPTRYSDDLWGVIQGLLRRAVPRRTTSRVLLPLLEAKTDECVHEIAPAALLPTIRASPYGGAPRMPPPQYTLVAAPAPGRGPRRRDRRLPAVAGALAGLPPLRSRYAQELVAARRNAEARRQGLPVARPAGLPSRHRRAARR